jgi:predicted hydrocarbon binding protein
MGRMLLLSGDEILGRSGMTAVLGLIPGAQKYIENYPPDTGKNEFPFDVISGLRGALLAVYGQQAGRGLLLRIGRASFQHGLRAYGHLFGLTDLAFRLLPMKTRLRVGANAFAEIFNKHSDQRVRVEETAQQISWVIELCPVCWGVKSDQLCCDLAVGLLQEALYWVSGGKTFAVREVACCAVGASQCVIVIDKEPFG